MRQNDRANPFQKKIIARQRYAERKIDKWVKWSWEIKGKIKWRELVEMQDKYKIKVE